MNASEMFLAIAGAFVELYNYVTGPMVPQAIQLRDAVVRFQESWTGQIARPELISCILEWLNTFQNIYLGIGLVGLVISFVLGLLWRAFAVLVSALGVWISYLIWRDQNWNRIFLTGEKGFAFFASAWLGLLLLYRTQGLLGKVCLLGIETLVIWVMYSMTTTNMEISWDYSNIHEIISRSVLPVPPYSSLPDLYRSLCASPIFLDDGYLSFSYDRATGKKCWMLGARLLLIDLADIPEYWNWRSLPESRFSQLAELRSARRLKIKGSISTYMLSPRTTYVAYLVYKFQDVSRSGFHNRPVSLRVVRVVNIRRQVVAQHNRVFLIGDMASQARTRSDGWMEIEFGEISYIEDGANIECIIEGSESFERKGGLIVEGIELRPR